MGAFKTIDTPKGTRVACCRCGQEITLIALRADTPYNAAMIEECMKGVLIHSLYTQHKGQCFGEPCEGRR